MYLSFPVYKSGSKWWVTITEGHPIPVSTWLTSPLCTSISVFIRSRQGKSWGWESVERMRPLILIKGPHQSSLQGTGDLWVLGPRMPWVCRWLVPAVTWSVQPSPFLFRVCLTNPSSSVCLLSRHSIKRWYRMWGPTRWPWGSALITPFSLLCRL